MATFTRKGHTRNAFRSTRAYCPTYKHLRKFHPKYSPNIHLSVCGSVHVNVNHQVLVFAPLTEVVDADNRMKQLPDAAARGAQTDEIGLIDDVSLAKVKKLERSGSLVQAQERMENDKNMKAQLESAHHSIPALRSHMIPE
eukprot:1186742-Prorocentrum_minimum.AAC.10